MNAAKDSTGTAPTPKRKADVQPKSPMKPPGSMTPEGRRYRILYGELKQKYLGQSKTVEKLNAEQDDLKQRLKDSNDKCKSLDEQLTNFAIENETLRQQMEQVEPSDNSSGSTEATISDCATEDSKSTSKQSESSNPICSSSNCIEDNDQYKFECTKCKYLFHYRCTELPTYQIAHFLTTNYRRYICINCTKVPDYVADVMKDRAPSRNHFCTFWDKSNIFKKIIFF